MFDLISLKCKDNEIFRFLLLFLKLLSLKCRQYPIICKLSHFLAL